MKYEQTLFFDTVDALVLANKQHRLKYDEIKSNVSSSVFAREFLSVRADIGRRSGKNSYILARAKENDLIISPRRLMNDCFVDAKAHKTFLPSFFIDEQVKEMKFDTIFINEPKLVYENISIDTIFSLASGDINQTFIFLGE